MSDSQVKKSSVAGLLKSNIKNYSMFLMLALIMIVFAVLTKGTNLNSRNFTNIFIQYSYVLILAVGMLQVIVIGDIDLSVGSVCAFVGAVSAMAYNSGAGILGAVLVALLTGMAIGGFQGFWVAYLKIPAFIVTLAGMLLFRGVTYIITHVNPIPIKDDGYKQLASGIFLESESGRSPGSALVVGVVILAVYIAVEFMSRNKDLKNNFEVIPLSLFIVKLAVIGALILGLSQRFASYRGLPIVVIVLGVTVFVFNFMMKNTVLGRYIYAVGGNARSAKLSGINSELITFVVFCFMGALAGLAGVVSTGYMNSALPQAGQNFELDAIAACYIGGVSASGGIGTVVGVIVGGLVMSAINNGMSLMNIGSDWQYVVKASILLLAVFYDVYTRRKAGLS
ncbi:MAG: sugar ABC transporter permease [Spirochaetaceae bacterium]|jgi:putative multiple sugar transport system permease protein|nr:sugar ABC transporter permease [Spirochaetaceae bacterium]